MASLGSTVQEIERSVDKLKDYRKRIKFLSIEEVLEFRTLQSYLFKLQLNVSEIIEKNSKESAMIIYGRLNEIGDTAKTYLGFHKPTTPEPKESTGSGVATNVGGFQGTKLFKEPTKVVSPIRLVEKPVEPEPEAEPAFESDGEGKVEKTGFSDLILSKLLRLC